MKAAVRSEYGSARDVIRLHDVDVPQPGPGELLVKVQSTTVNRTDCAFLRGEPKLARAVTGFPKPRNRILGCEFAGIVSKTGPGTTAFQVGDRVFGFDNGKFGGHAEYLSISQSDMVATLPTDSTWNQGATSTEGLHYALNDLRKAQIRPEQRLLIYGATGAIGSAAVQLAKFYGANVSAVCDGKDIAVVESLGADVVIARESFNLAGHPVRYDFFFDAVGKLRYSDIRELLTPKGIYCSTDLGPFPQNPLLALATPLGLGRRVIFPIPKRSQADAQFVGQLLESGQFTPLIDRTYSLDQIAEAYKYVETGQKIGNVVIEVAV